MPIKRSYLSQITFGVAFHVLLTRHFNWGEDLWNLFYSRHLVKLRPARERHSGLWDDVHKVTQTKALSYPPPPTKQMLRGGDIWGQQVRQKAGD